MPSSGKTLVKLRTRHTAMHHNTMVCVCGGTAASPQRRQVEALFPTGWGRCSHCPVLLGPCLGLVGLFHGKGFSGGVPESFLLAPLQQSNWRSFDSSCDSFQEEIHLSAHYHFSIIYIFPSRGEYFVVTGHRLFPLPWEARANRLSTWKLLPEALQLPLFLTLFFYSFLSLMAVWVLETSYTTPFFWFFSPSSSITEQISRLRRRGKRDWCAEPPLPIRLWLWYNRYSWFETANTFLPNWISHKLIIAKCSWQRKV